MRCALLLLVGATVALLGATAHAEESAPPRYATLTRAAGLTVIDGERRVPVPNSEGIDTFSIRGANSERSDSGCGTTSSILRRM